MSKFDDHGWADVSKILMQVMPGNFKPLTKATINGSQGVVASGGTGNATIPAPAVPYHGSLISPGFGTMQVGGSPSQGNYGITFYYSPTSYAPTMESELPDTVLEAIDEHDNDVKITFKPEADLTAVESLQLMLLFRAYDECGTDNVFNALKYIEKRNLERHFKFEVI